MNAEPLKSTQGPYFVIPSEGCFDILDVNQEVVAMAHEFNVAVLLASSSELLDACIEIHEIAQEIDDPEMKERIEARLSLAFEKMHAEADI